MTYNEIVKRISDSLSKNKMILFYGAGVSRRPPSCLPTVMDYIDGLLEVWCADPFIKSNKRLLAISMKKLRFERLMEIFYEHIFDNTFRLMDFYHDAKPNIYHYFAANVASKYGCRPIITTNFDDLLEKAHGEIDVKFDVAFDNLTSKIKLGKDCSLILKPHGSLSYKGKTSCSSIKTTIDRIWKGLGSEPYLYQILENIVHRYNILFLGYSCFDNLTINPVFYSKSDSLKDIFIVAHTLDTNIPKIETVKDISERKPKDSIDNFLLSLGKGFRINIDTSVLIDDLIATLHLNKAYKINDSHIKHLSIILDHIIYWFNENGIILHLYQIISSIFRETGEFNLAYKFNKEIIASMDKLLSIKLQKKISKTANIDSDIIRQNSATMTVIKGRAHASQGDIFRILGQLNNSKNEMMKAIKLLSSVSDVKGLAITHHNLSTVLLEMNNNKEALSHAFKAVEYGNMSKDKYLVGDLLINLGVLYSKNHEYDKSIDIYRKAKKYPLSAIQSIHLKNNLSVAYLRMKYYKKALIESQFAYFISVQIQEHSLTAHAAITIGDIWFNQNNLSEARIWYETAHNLNKYLPDYLKRVIKSRIDLLT